MCIAIDTTAEEVNVCHLRKCVVYGAVVCSRDTAYALLTGYELLHTLPYSTHSSVFLIEKSISRISTQQWISRNLFTFGPMLIGNLLLN